MAAVRVGRVRVRHRRVVAAPLSEVVEAETLATTTGMGAHPTEEEAVVGVGQVTGVDVPVPLLVVVVVVVDLAGVLLPVALGAGTGAAARRRTAGSKTSGECGWVVGVGGWVLMCMCMR